MSYELILQFINTCGFPIGCVLLLAYYIKDLNAQHREEVKAMSERIDKMTDAISTLTTQLAKVFLLEEQDKEN